MGYETPLLLSLVIITSGIIRLIEQFFKDKDKRYYDAALVHIGFGGCILIGTILQEKGDYLYLAIQQFFN